MFKKACLMAFCVIYSLLICSCQNNGQASNEVINPVVQEKNKIEFEASSFTYNFPEFLKNSENLTLLSRVLYKSFDYDKCNMKIENTVNDKFVCDRTFLNGSFYRFIGGENFGIINADGEIIIDSVCSEIVQIRPDLFELIIDGKLYYATTDAENGLKIVEDESFDWVFNGDKPTVEQTNAVVGENLAETARYAIKTPDGKNVYDRTFETVAESNKDSYENSPQFVFTAYSEGVSYIILFDKYYNYTVYEGSYGTVSVAIGDEIGSCNILSYDDYHKLLSLVSSFDISEKKIVSKTNRIVQIKFSHYAGDETTVMLCSNGYFEITSVDPTTREPITTITTVSRECFSDVVEFVDTVISSEYTEG